jgi:hypothetical protein
MDGKPVVAALLDPNGGFPGNGVTDAGLRPRRRHDDQVAETGGGVSQRVQTLGINSIIIAEQYLH